MIIKLFSDDGELKKTIEGISSLVVAYTYSENPNTRASLIVDVGDFEEASHLASSALDILYREIIRKIGLYNRHQTKEDEFRTPTFDEFVDFVRVFTKVYNNKNIYPEKMPDNFIPMNKTVKDKDGNEITILGIDRRYNKMNKLKRLFCKHKNTKTITNIREEDYSYYKCRCVKLCKDCR